MLWLTISRGTNVGPEIPFFYVFLSSARVFTAADNINSSDLPSTKVLAARPNTHSSNRMLRPTHNRMKMYKIFSVVVNLGAIDTDVHRLDVNSTYYQEYKIPLLYQKHLCLQLLYITHTSHTSIKKFVILGKADPEPQQNTDQDTAIFQFWRPMCTISIVVFLREDTNTRVSRGLTPHLALTKWKNWGEHSMIQVRMPTSSNGNTKKLTKDIHQCSVFTGQCQHHISTPLAVSCKYSKSDVATTFILGQHRQ